MLTVLIADRDICLTLRIIIRELWDDKNTRGYLKDHPNFITPLVFANFFLLCPSFNNPPVIIIGQSLSYKVTK